MIDENIPLVSVIIPTYNRIKYINRAIESIFAQTYKNYEVIVVDDGSALDVKEAIRSYMNGITYVYQEHGGLAAARNTGINISKGKYLAFLDDDDVFEPKKLEIQIPILEENTDIGFVYSDHILFNEHFSLCVSDMRCPIGQDFNKVFFMDHRIAIPTVLIKRECFDGVGLFDEFLRQHEDGNLLLRISMHWKVKFSNYPSARVRLHSEMMSRNRVEIYSSIIQSSKKILVLYPAFKESLGGQVDRRFGELYFELGKAYLRKGKLYAAFCNLNVSRKLLRRYANTLGVYLLLYDMLINIVSKICNKLVER